MRRALALLALLPFLTVASAREVRSFVSDWDGEEGLITLLEVNTERGPYNLANFGQIDAAGHFALTLPDAEVAPLLGPAKEMLSVVAPGCRDEVRLDSPQAQANVFMLAVHDGNVHLGNL